MYIFYALIDDHLRHHYHHHHDCNGVNNKHNDEVFVVVAVALI